ncbi:MAG: hypothetical protein K6T91_01960 [Firmicutes bacterium]|nr:hypothetical protein [Bacillota bacterium]
MGFTKKGLIFSLLALVILLLAPAAVFAAGYNDPLQYTVANGYPQGPHGGYTTTTNKCKECHAVHLATGSYVLTRSNTASEACDFCHNPSTGLATKKVSMNANGHGINAGAPEPLVAPDDTTPTAFSISQSNWGCDSCHSVHNNSVVILADVGTSKLLKADPNPGKNYLFYNPSLIDTSTRQTPQKLAAWCSACHNANLGSHKTSKQAWTGTTAITAYSHDSSETSTSLDGSGFALDVNPKDEINKGPNCRQCHPAEGGSFPHSGAAPSMLVSGASQSGTDKNYLDAACINCHNTAALP